MTTPPDDDSGRFVVLSGLAADVGHEMNNILSAVLAYAEFIAEDADLFGWRRVASDVEQLRRAARRGVEVVRRLQVAADSAVADDDGAVVVVVDTVGRAGPESG